MGQIIKLIDSNTKDNVNYEEVTTWHNGTPMDDTKVDNIIYRKKGDKYYHRKYEGAINVKWFGAKGSGSVNDRPAIQKAIDSAMSGETIIFPAGRYLITSPLIINKPLIIEGNGQFTTIIIALNCNGIEIPGISNILIRNIEVAHAVRYTNTANTYIGIDIQGSTSLRPFNIILENVYIDGFLTALKTNYLWNAKFDNLKTGFCHNGLKVYGLSVNNVLTNSNFSCDNTESAYGIEFAGDIPSEGWMIDNILVYGAGIGVLITANAHIYITNSIIDFCLRIGIYIRSSGTNMAGNNVIDSCYIAMSDQNGDCGISLANGIDNFQIRGNRITNNTILSYNGSKCLVGVRVVGNFEKYNLIQGNTISNFFEHDINAANGVNHIISNNHCLSAVELNIIGGTFINNNVGTVYYERSHTKSTLGKITITYDEVIPIWRTWSVGDICYKVNPIVEGVSGSRYILQGWRCTVAGTPGTWVPMRTLTGD